MVTVILVCLHSIAFCKGKVVAVPKHQLVTVQRVLEVEYTFLTLVQDAGQCTVSHTDRLFHTK